MHLEANPLNTFFKIVTIEFTTPINYYKLLNNINFWYLFVTFANDSRQFLFPNRDDSLDFSGEEWSINMIDFLNNLYTYENSFVSSQMIFFGT